MHIYRHELDRLGRVLSDPTFGQLAPTVGAELEIVLVDPRGRPACVGTDVLERLNTESFVPELMQYQLEYNARPHPLMGRPFTTQGHELSEALGAVSAGSPPEVEPALIGILPTLTLADLERDRITHKPRYRQLDEALRLLNKPTYVLELGDLRVEFDSLSLQGANTSFQTHLTVKPADYGRTYNAAQLASALVLAISCNSPCLLGRCAWHETRIPIFRQATRGRAPFGNRWIHDAYDLFSQVIESKEPLLPKIHAAVEDQPYPVLRNLRQINSTVWYWNRPVYDPAGNLRIESRYLPSGPTITDMMANAALVIGLTLGLRERMDGIIADGFPFAIAKHNFYAAAHHSLEAELAWPGRTAQPASRLILSLLQLAHDGLCDIGGVAESEADRFLGVIERRAVTGQTGAAWQIAMTDRLSQGSSTASMAAMFNLYRLHSAMGDGDPVHTWPR